MILKILYPLSNLFAATFIIMLAIWQPLVLMRKIDDKNAIRSLNFLSFLCVASLCAVYIAQMLVWLEYNATAFSLYFWAVIVALICIMLLSHKKDATIWLGSGHPRTWPPVSKRMAAVFAQLIFVFSRIYSKMTWGY